MFMPYICDIACDPTGTGPKICRKGLEIFTRAIFQVVLSWKESFQVGAKSFRVKTKSKMED